MSGEITGAALEGARVTITPDCWPCQGKVNRIQVSMTKQTWNGVVTLNRGIAIEETPDQVDAAIVQTVKEMAETIELPHNWKG